jgi:hypothetical protein
VSATDFGRGGSTAPGSELATTPEGSQWRIEIPSPGFWLSDNDSRRNVYAHSRRVQAWRSAAYIAARSVKPRIPTGIDVVRVDVLFRFAIKPVEEISNLRATVKACVDGAVGRKRGTAPGYGIVVADSDRHVKYGSYGFELIDASPARLALNPNYGFVVLTVTDISGSASC